MIEGELARFHQRIEGIQERESLVYMPPARWAEQLRASCVAPLIKGFLTLRQRVPKSSRAPKHLLQEFLILDLLQPLLDRARKKQIMDYARYGGTNSHKLIKELEEALLSVYRRVYEEVVGGPPPKPVSESLRKAAQSPSKKTSNSQRIMAEAQRALDRGRKTLQQNGGTTNRPVLQEEALERIGADMKAVMEQTLREFQKSRAKSRKAAKTAPKPERQVKATAEEKSRFPTPPGTPWEDVTIDFIEERKIKIEARGNVDEYFYDDIEFGKKRDGKPTKLWGVFRNLAILNGCASADELTTGEIKRKNVPKYITDLRKKLFGLMGIKGDPFAEIKNYQTKFTLQATFFKPFRPRKSGHSTEAAFLEATSHPKFQVKGKRRLTSDQQFANSEDEISS